MGKGNGFNAMFSVEFESFASVKRKLDLVTNQINSATKKNGIKLNINTEDISKTMQDIGKLSKQQINIMSNGQVTTVTKFNNELGKTITLKENLSKGTKEINLVENADKQRKDLENMYKGMFDSIENQQKSYTKLFDEASAKEKKMVNEMANSREKSEKRKQDSIKKTEKAQTDAINKAIEQSKKQEQQERQEEQRAKEQIRIEQEKLKIKQKSIELNRQQLADSNRMNAVSNNIGGLSGSTVAEVKKNADAISRELQRIDQQARLKGAREGQTNITGLSASFRNMASSMGIFFSTAMAIRQVGQVVRDSVQYVSYLDKSFTDLNITMDISKSQFDNMASEVQKMGIAVGTSSKSVMDIARVYANASTTIDEVMQKIEPSVWLSNVARMDGTEVTKVLQSVINQFKLIKDEGDDVTQITERVGSSLVAVSQNMAYDFGSGVRELTDAIKTAGSVAEVSGQSMESFMALSGAFIEVSGKTGLNLAQYKFSLIDLDS